MTTIFDEHKINPIDQKRLIGAATRQDNDDMKIVLDQEEYKSLTNVQRIDVKNYAKGIFFIYDAWFFILFLLQMECY